MNETRAGGIWRQLSVFIVLAIFGCMLAFSSGCPNPPQDEKKTENTNPDTKSDGGPADEKPKDDAPKDDTNPKDDPPKDDPPKDDPPKDDPPVDGTPTKGSGEPTAAAATAKNQYSPLDASPSPDGKLIYFTAFKKPSDDVNEPNTQGSNEGALFSVNVDGTGTKELAGGFMNPTGLVVSKDGSTIYVADSGQVKSEDDGNDTGADALGAIYTVPSSGGSKTALNGTSGYQPKSLDVIDENGDQVYFSGVDPNDEKPGVFRVAGAGGNINVVSKDDKLQDPSGVAVAVDGTVYVAETVGGTGGNTSSIYVISNGALSEFVGDIKVGYPAGIALSHDEKFLLVSGIEPAEKTALVYRIELASKQYTTYNKGIDTNSDSAGLHRAHNCDAYAWANADYPTLDDQGNPTGGGTVYLISTKAGCK